MTAQSIPLPTYGQGELEARLTPILDAVLSVYDPERVILYGSAAQGLRWHDLDLIVVTETADPFPERQRKVAEALARVQHVPADVLVYTPAEIGQSVAENRFFIVQEVLEKGRTVYDRGGRVTRSASDARSAADDLRVEGVEPLTDEMAADAHAWLQYAVDDRRFALHTVDGGFYPQTCFVSQQAVEKLLKALLLAHGQAPPRTHSLPTLLALCGELHAELADLATTAASLDRYYLATRYPDVSLPGGPYREEHAREALTASQTLFETIEPLVRDRLGRTDT